MENVQMNSAFLYNFIFYFDYYTNSCLLLNPISHINNNINYIIKYQKKKKFK